MDLQMDEKLKKLPGSDKLASMCVWKHTAFNYLDTPQVTTARTWPEIMDLLASETARLVLSYTLDQHLPATSKQLVSRLLMTLLNCHPFVNFTKLLSPQVSECRHLAELANLPPAQLRRASRVGGRSLQDVLREFQVSWATSYFSPELHPWKSGHCWRHHRKSRNNTGGRGRVEVILYIGENLG